MEDFLRANRDKLLDMMNHPGWHVFQTQVVDPEMIATIEAMLLLDAENTPDFRLKYAHLKGKFDFIRQLYHHEEMVRCFDEDVEKEMEKQEAFLGRFRDKLKGMYFAILAKFQTIENA